MHYNIVLRIMSLIILICVLLLYVNVREGYEDAVPAYCGTAGSKITNGIIELQKIQTELIYLLCECIQNQNVIN